MSRRPSVHVAACGPINRMTAKAIGTVAGLVMRDIKVRVALHEVVTAHELYVAHLVGVDCGVIKRGPKERAERMHFWMRVCEAVCAGRRLLDPKTKPAAPRAAQKKRTPTR